MEMYLVTKNTDFTEGRGAMAPHKLFSEKQTAHDYIMSKAGIYGSPQKFTPTEYGGYYNGYKIKEMEVENVPVRKKLTYKNNWENHEYYLNGQLMYLHENEEYEVVINGNVQTVFSMKVTETVHDHGKSYTTSSYQLFVDFSESMGLPKGTIKQPLSGLLKNGVKIYMDGKE